MAKEKRPKTGDGSAVGHNTLNACSAFKRATLINDRLVPMPDGSVTETMLRSQGGVPDDHILLRDHNDPNDVVIRRGAPVDLSDGDVFYSVPECAIRSDRGECHGEAKRLIVANDVPEVVVIPRQSGAAIRFTPQAVDWIGSPMR